MNKSIILGLLAGLCANAYAGIQAITPYYVVQNKLSTSIYVFEDIPQTDGITYTASGWVEVKPGANKLIKWQAVGPNTTVIARDAAGNYYGDDNSAGSNCVANTLDVNNLQVASESWPVLPDGAMCSDDMVAKPFHLIAENSVWAITPASSVPVDLGILAAYAQHYKLQDGLQAEVNEWNQANPNAPVYQVEVK